MKDEEEIRRAEKEFQENLRNELNVQENEARAIQKEIDEAIAKLYENEGIAKFETINGKHFNPNSTVQLRSLLFDFLGLSPTGKKTGTGANSTDAEVLEELAQQSDIPGLILAIRQKS